MSFLKLIAQIIHTVNPIMLESWNWKLFFFRVEFSLTKVRNIASIYYVYAMVAYYSVWLFSKRPFMLYDRPLPREYSYHQLYIYMYMWGGGSLCRTWQVRFKLYELWGNYEFPREFFFFFFIKDTYYSISLYMCI